MINLLIIGNDINLTKQVLKNIPSEALIACDENYNSKIAKVLDIKDTDILFVHKNNISTFKSYSSKCTKNRIISLAFDENKKLSQRAMQSINKLIKNSISEKKQKIEEELQSIGFNPDQKGTYYLKEVILEVEKYSSLKIPSLQTKIYPIIAKRNHVSANNVKNCILNASNTMYCECDVEKLKKYFNLPKDEKPKIERIIHTIINKIN